MKLLVILGSDEIVEPIARSLKPLGFDLIRYTHILKAMDNIDEIDPSSIIINAKDFPRHWKTMVQFVRYDRGKDVCPIILLAGKEFPLEEASKAFYLGVSGIVSEDLRTPSDLDQIQRVLSRYIQIDDKRRTIRYHVEALTDIGICTVNPVTKGMFTGQIQTISASGLSFHPEDTAPLDTITENMELSECSLRIGEDFITPICRVVRISPDMSLEFIFLPALDRILLDNYLESLPLQGLKAKREETQP